MDVDVDKGIEIEKDNSIIKDDNYKNKIRQNFQVAFMLSVTFQYCFICIKRNYHIILRM